MISPLVGSSSPPAKRGANFDKDERPDQLAAASQVLPGMVIPTYRSSTLGELLPSIGAHLGVSNFTEDAFRLP